MSIEQDVRTIEQTKAQIWPLMKGLGPAVQSAIIADMLASLLAGHAPPLRGAALKAILNLTLQLVPINEEQQFRGLGHPYTWPDEEKDDGEGVR